jgi:hypothetical protein
VLLASIVELYLLNITKTKRKGTRYTVAVSADEKKGKIEKRRQKKTLGVFLYISFTVTI